MATKPVSQLLCRQLEEKTRNGIQYTLWTARRTGLSAAANQFGDEDHIDLAGLRQRQDLLVFEALLLCP